MSYNTPKNIPPEDIYFGVRVSDRDITIPIKASRLPAIHYISTDFVIPFGQYTMLDVPKIYDEEIGFGVGVGAPIVSQANATKDTAMDFGIGIGIDSIGDHVCFVGANMNIDLIVEPIMTQGHLAAVNIAHDLMSDAFFASSSTAPEIKMGIGVGLDTDATAEDAVDVVIFGVGIGMEAESQKSRKRVLSHLEDATPADLSDMTLQELYWIDDQ